MLLVRTAQRLLLVTCSCYQRASAGRVRLSHWSFTAASAEWERGGGRGLVTAVAAGQSARVVLRRRRFTRDRVLDTEMTV